MDKQLLIQVIMDQAREPLPEMLIPRGAFQELSPLVDTKQVIILSGIRRCGKSVLMHVLRQHKPESDYSINFDDDRLALFQLEHFPLLVEAFVELYGVQSTFYFDEIQNIPGWERFVRRLHNEGKKVFITGSNASLLSSELGTHLTGRYIAIKLFPFSFPEYIHTKDPGLLSKSRLTSTETALIKKYFAEFKVMGGMPEYLENGQKKYLQALYENILYKDIIVRNKLPQQKPIKELVYYLASNNAKEFTYNSLRKLLGLSSANTVSEYCHYLENSFLCFTLNRFSYSLKKQAYSTKKIYFIDQALAESVGFRFSEDQGRTLENIVYLQLARQNKELYFHKDKQECDFLVRDGYDISEAIQVCVSLKDEKTKKREIGGLIEAMVAYKLKAGLIITEGESFTESIEYDGKHYSITTKPCWEWLLENPYLGVES
jgi:hypothetical protein